MPNDGWSSKLPKFGKKEQDRTDYTKNGPSCEGHEKKPFGIVSESCRNQQGHRELRCSCFDGRYVSVTRRKPEHASFGKEPLYSWMHNERNPQRYAFSSFDVAKQLDKILGNSSHPQGLLLISGSTGSGKSRIARSLIRLILLRLSNPTRRAPHLVTYEDPIELPLSEDPDDLKKHFHVDYTPRALGKDVMSLDDALRDALRQTPSIFYVGETRDPQDWPKLVQFAGTGHLVVTTSHAGALTECIGQILDAVKATTPAARSVVASRTLGVVHLKKLESSKNIIATLPAMWRRTSQSQMKLVSDGLSSVLPYRQGDTKLGMYGRAWFAEKLCSKDREILQQALNDDLRG